MSVIVRVLYEDARDGDEPFGLHNLVLAIVGDITNQPSWKIEKRVTANPRKGNSVVLRDLEFGTNALTIAVLDDDRIRTQPSVFKQLSESMPMPTNATRRQVANAVWTHAKQPDHAIVVILKENAESVIEAIISCSSDLDPQVVARARRKKLDARDLLFNQVARMANRSTRDCVAAKVPTLHRLANHIVCELTRRDAI